jgi:S-DNA-T family DNA segregation ATPase FtsK/SpoIIIE
MPENDFAQSGTTEQRAMAEQVEKALRTLHVEGEVFRVEPGPVVTKYLIRVTTGQSACEMYLLGDALNKTLDLFAVRIVALGSNPLVIALEIPSPKCKVFPFGESIASKEFRNHTGRLPFVLGRNHAGEIIVEDLTRLSNLLLAGSSGSGKSIFIKTLLLSLVTRLSPDDLKIILIDTRELEFAEFAGLPHVQQPIVTCPEKAVEIFEWAVKEKLRRYELFSAQQVRNIDDYNRNLAADRDSGLAPGGEEPGHQHLQRLVIVVDELSDLMICDSEAIDLAVAHLAPYGRAVGIHMVVSSMRTSPAVMTGLIKANFPVRLAFKMMTRVDSLQFHDQFGAETLLGNGDMLFLPPASCTLERLQGAYIPHEEVAGFVVGLKERLQN